MTIMKKKKKKPMIFLNVYLRNNNFVWELLENTNNNSYEDSKTDFHDIVFFT